MKRTKSMIYNKTDESRKLLLYAINDWWLYDNMIMPVIIYLRKKAEKGTYESDKAVDAYYRIACEAPKRYEIDFGYSFSVQARFSCAVDMEKYYKENEVFYGLENNQINRLKME